MFYYYVGPVLQAPFLDHRSGLKYLNHQTSYYINYLLHADIIVLYV